MFKCIFVFAKFYWMFNGKKGQRIWVLPLTYSPIMNLEKKKRVNVLPILAWFLYSIQHLCIWGGCVCVCVNIHIQIPTLLHPLFRFQILNPSYSKLLTLCLELLCPSLGTLKSPYPCFHWYSCLIILSFFFFFLYLMLQ